MTPEFSRRVRVDGLPPGGIEHSVQADAAECAALAVRLQVPAIASLVCHYRLFPVSGGRVAAAGRLSATLTRVCVVSLDEFATGVEDVFDVVFVPADLIGEDDDPDAPDEIPYEGGMVDLGEATTEQLALALEPYPRKPGAELPADFVDAGGSAFAALAQLRRPN